MLRRMFVAAAVVACVTFGVIAGEYKGAITKYEAGKTLTIKNKKEEKTLTIHKDVKVSAEDGQKLGKIGEKGVRATVTTNDKDEVTEIKVAAPKK